MTQSRTYYEELAVWRVPSNPTNRLFHFKYLCIINRMLFFRFKLRYFFLSLNYVSYKPLQATASTTNFKACVTNLKYFQYLSMTRKLYVLIRSSVNKSLSERRQHEIIASVLEYSNCIFMNWILSCLHYLFVAKLTNGWRFIMNFSKRKFSWWAEK